MAQNRTYACQIKPFVLYNETQAKLIMKDVFVNDNRAEERALGLKKNY